jgi:hypothetical protein
MLDSASNEAMVSFITMNVRLNPYIGSPHSAIRTLYAK